MDHRDVAASTAKWYKYLNVRRMLATVELANAKGDEEEVQVSFK